MKNKAEIRGAAGTARQRRKRLSEFDNPDAVCGEQGRCYPCICRQAAGGTSGLEQGGGDFPGLGNGKTLTGPLDELVGNIASLPVNDRRPSSQDIVAVASDQIGRRPRSGQAAQLFRTDRNPAVSGQSFHAGWGRVCPAVVTGAETGQAGADKQYLLRCMRHNAAV